MKYQMKLDESQFELAKSGEKIIEIRLYDRKRRLLNPGDVITFSKQPDLNEQLHVKVTGLLRYGTFKELVNDFPISFFGYPDDYDKLALIESMYTHYTKGEEQEYGVIGIKFKLL